MDQSDRTPIRTREFRRIGKAPQRSRLEGARQNASGRRTTARGRRRLAGVLANRLGRNDPPLVPDFTGGIYVGGETRSQLLDHAKGGGDLDWNDKAAAGTRIGEMLALVGATTEYQFG